jgi:asparagine synthase (glutamine-hydrolysing)
MTLLTGILDPDPLRTSRFLEGSRKLAPDLPWRKHTDTRRGRLSLSLDGAPKTPYSTFKDSGGRSVFVLGDILPNTETETDNAARLNQQCIKRGPEMLGRQNGYYLAGMIDQHDAVYLAADQLGLMPLYYWAGPEHFCFSTCPNAFLSHPSFTAKPDLMGIAGILLTMHGTGNRTTWQDVRRLPPGHLLRWRKGEGITLSDVNTLKAHDSHFGWSPSHCQNLIQNTFNEAVKRLAKLGETSVLLSGGLDSRLVAGTLRWHARYKVPVVTLGESNDYEMRCARRVASSLGWPMHPVPVDLDAYPRWAPIQARLEGMQSSFVEFMWWQAAGPANKLKPRIMTGLLGDSVMGGSHLAEGFNKDFSEYDFRAQFKSVNRLGFKAEVISKLIGQPGLAEAIVEELHKTWSGYDGMSFQKCWLFDLHHRQRHHVSGAAWRLSYGAWPTFPYVDQDLLNVMAGMAAPAFAERIAQINMLSHKLPQLAALPLDRGGPDMRPLMFSPASKLRHILLSRFDSWKLPGKQIERRQFVRHYDVNNQGWHAVRQLAENNRPLMKGLLDATILDNMLPGPSAPLVTPDPIVDGARYKTIVGLLLQLGTFTNQSHT